MTLRIVLLRGKPTAGKSTAFHNLLSDKRMDNWVFIDHPGIKNIFHEFENETKKRFGKHTLFYAIKQLLPLKKDIILEEMSRETLMSNLGKEIKKYKYKIIVFQFEISFKTALKRDIERSNEGKHPFMGKLHMKKMHQMHKEKLDKKAIIVNCDKLNEKQVVDFIVKKLR